MFYFSMLDVLASVFKYSVLLLYLFIFVFLSELHLSNAICVQVNFLSQVRLSHEGDGPKVAKRLIEVYFALFKVWKKKCCACFL